MFLSPGIGSFCQPFTRNPKIGNFCQQIIILPFDDFLMQNGSFRGFGFADKTAAIEMKDRVVKAVKPYSIGSNPTPISCDENPAESSGKSSVVSYRSVPRRSASRRLTNAGIN